MSLHDSQKKQIKAYQMYGARERNCLARPEKMTQEMFEKCLDICAAACDAEEYMRICTLFPRFARAYMNHVDSLMADAGPNRKPFSKNT